MLLLDLMLLYFAIIYCCKNSNIYNLMLIHVFVLNTAQFIPLDNQILTLFNSGLGP